MNFGNRIGDLKQSMVQQVSEAATTVRPRSAISGNGDLKQTDETTLSSTAGLVGQALNETDVRADKVEALRKVIQDGTYKVSSTAVADKLIQSMGE